VIRVPEMRELDFLVEVDFEQFETLNGYVGLVRPQSKFEEIEYLLFQKFLGKRPANRECMKVDGPYRSGSGIARSGPVLGPPLPWLRSDRPGPVLDRCTTLIRGAKELA